MSRFVSLKVGVLRGKVSEGLWLEMHRGGCLYCSVDSGVGGGVGVDSGVVCGVGVDEGVGCGDFHGLRRICALGQTERLAFFFSAGSERRRVCERRHDAVFIWGFEIDQKLRCWSE